MKVKLKQIFQKHSVWKALYTAYEIGVYAFQYLTIADCLQHMTKPFDQLITHKSNLQSLKHFSKLRML